MAVIVPAAVFIIAVAMAIAAGTSMAAPITTSAWLMPLIVSIAMAIVSAIIAIAEMVQRRPAALAAEGPQVDARRSTPLRIAGWIVLCAGYVIVTPRVGFEWATLVFLVLALKVFGGASWRVTLPAAIAISLIVPLVFRQVFYTLVP